MRKLTKNECIIDFEKIHGGRYDYSKFINNGCKKLSIIICKTHGDFPQTPDSHKRGRGCPKCIGVSLSNTEHIEIFNEIHNNLYDYTNFNFIKGHTDSIVTCEIHGDFPISPSNHKMGKGCPKCVGKGLSNKERVEEYNNIHNNLYDYSKFIFIESHTNSIIICKKHGDFTQTPSNHRSGQGCPKCKLSKGETKILNFLTSSNIIYERQKEYESCKYIRQLPFDFYLPNKNICIEYDGEQHYVEKSIFGGKEGLINTKRNDNIKNKYCRDNNIKLLRIPYWEFKNIEDILKNNI